VLTANHWWLDALAAAVLVPVAIWIDTPIQHWLERRESRRLVPPDDDPAEETADLATVG